MSRFLYEDPERMRARGRAVSEDDKRKLLDRLMAAWTGEPGLRLGQLIWNATHGKDIFDAEDEQLIREIEEFAL